jgi:hypothetical protein
VSGTQAPGADSNLARGPVHRLGDLVNVGHEAGAGTPLGVADVVAPHADLATGVAFHDIDPCLTALPAVARIECKAYHISRMATRYKGVRRL